MESKQQKAKVDDSKDKDARRKRETHGREELVASKDQEISD